ncbi:hypothetical protein [Pampinifervens florentissimum]|uniref:hypothetical protein n=1 Tax=Pampinifervens florentissimum TaxID=1632019 RepID=UPI0013B4972E|nr:hypothetical protein [Hydrogenobacter sp. T-8]QID34155.1 hypothetical protein G3M65_10375 [Hydrogenobacter sp. T-8]
MVLHPLFAYPTVLLALGVFALYIVSLLKLRGMMRYALYLNVVLIVFALLSVVFGFGISNVPLVQSKVPFIWGFPHKWNGIFLLILSVLTFVVFWFKGETAGKKLILLPAVGILVVLFQFFTGWMLRLVFFS